MVELQGNRGCKVPVLLTKEMKEAMQLLVEKREAVNINPANVFLFATPSTTSVNHLCSWDCLQKLSNAEGLNLKKSKSHHKHPFEEVHCYCLSSAGPRG